jgi:UDP-MurNAc hydroxylase
MKITFLGHAGLFIETERGSILCDPWFNPAYLCSWFPFPANDHIDPARIANPDFLYVSHQHYDHYDPQFLIKNVSKKARVLMPAYPLKRFRSALEDCGFKHFVDTVNNEPVDLDGLRVMIMALTSPADGPTGDSGLVVDDGRTIVFDQNDSHPMDVTHATSLGHVNAHFLQFSGAIWYPFVYNFPDDVKQALARKKRIDQQERAYRFLETVGADHVFPCAGPPCFLDDALYPLNDFDNSDANTFCDQNVFLETMRRKGRHNGHLMVPGTVIEIDGAKSCTVTHPMAQEKVDAIFSDKRGYLEAYRARKQGEIKAFHDALPRNQVDILATIKERFEPILARADIMCRNIKARVLIDCSPRDQVVIDFVRRKVYPFDGERCRYKFFVEPALIEDLLVRRCEDWVNELFLSCRFRAERDGPYNEYLYSFFKCLTPERVEYAENYFAAHSGDEEMCELGGYHVQRFCPHQRADLQRFGKVEDGVLTCLMHGWRFDLKTGRCLTADTHKIKVAGPVPPPADAAE